MKRIQVIIFCLLLLVVGNGVAAELTYEQLVEKVEEQILAVDQISTTAIIEVNQGDFVNRIVLSIEASVSDKITRVEILEPSIMAGQIVIADQEQDLVKMYMPSLNQIIIQSGADMAAGMGLGLDFVNLDNLFGFAEMDGYIDQMIETESGLNYLVVIKDLEEQMELPQEFAGLQGETGEQVVWINHEFMPFRVDFSVSEQLYASLLLEDLAINEAVGDADIQRMPNVPEIRY